jgi:hypothetical protein
LYILRTLSAFYVFYILSTFGTVRGNLVYFSRFGILYEEKSGNPGLNRLIRLTWRKARFDERGHAEPLLDGVLGQQASSEHDTVNSDRHFKSLRHDSGAYVVGVVVLLPVCGKQGDQIGRNFAYKGIGWLFTLGYFFKNDKSSALLGYFFHCSSFALF